MYTLYIHVYKNGVLNNKHGDSARLNGLSNMASWAIPELNQGSNGTNHRTK